MEISVNSASVRCYVVNLSITINDVTYSSDIELYSYGGGLDQGDMEIIGFEDDNGNVLNDYDIDEVYAACVNAL